MNERVVIVGRPNVGKSSLFNRIVSARRALVSDVSGTTVDYIESPVEWNGKKFILADTGGWFPSPGDAVHMKMRDIAAALAAGAAAVIFVADGAAGLAAADEDFARTLRKLAKNIIVAVNKADTDARAAAAADFWRLGLGAPVAVSAATGRGVDELLDAAAAFVADESRCPSPAIVEKIPRVIILGRPNAGKSTLLNRLASAQRTITDPRAGTTRESVDAIVERNGRKIVFIDTPGIARKRKFDKTLDYLSYVSMNKFVEKADVAVLLADAAEGLTKADEALAGIVAENCKACVVAFNKWDAAENKEKLFAELRKEFARRYNFLSYARFISISAATGLRVNELVGEILAAYEAYNFKPGIKELEDIIREAVMAKPAVRGAKKLYLRKVRSVSCAPPTAILEVNEPSLAHFSYRRYLLNAVRGKYNLDGAPVKLVITKDTAR